ncbi:MAG: sugar-binding domain-containing protein [Spirochaetota bacterium]
MNLKGIENKKTSLLIEIARAYYEENRTQSEIAASTGVTRSQISRYLKEARKLGIVQIRIVDPESEFEDLVASMKQRFPHLRDVIVAPVYINHPESTLEIVGRYAANYLLNVVSSGMRVVIGCGRTLRVAVLSLTPRGIPNVSVIQAMGNLGHEAHGIDYNEITRVAAHAFGAKPYFISSPAILGEGSGNAADIVNANKTIRDVLEMAHRGDIYVVGLGTVKSDQLYVRVGMIQQKELDELGGNAAGDIFGRFFDIRGNELSSAFAERIIGVELEDLRRSNLSIGVAAGPDKAAPLLGALRGKFINVVVSDENTIQSVIAMNESK